MIEGLAKYPGAVKELTFSLIRYMLLHTDLTPEEALRQVFQEYGYSVEMSDEEFLEKGIVTSKAIYFVRNYIREEVIRALLENGQPVHVFEMDGIILQRVILRIGRISMEKLISWKRSH